MSRIPLLTRREAVAGLVAFPALLGSWRLFAQVPSPSIATSPSQSLRDVLSVVPITTYEGVLLEPVPWIGTSASPYLSSVGGVHVLITDRGAAPFGSYVVYRDQSAAKAGVRLGRQALESRIVRSSAVTVEGYDGEAILYDDSGSYAITLVPVDNVLIIGNDTIVKTGNRLDAEDNRARSIDHATVLIDHLLGVLERNA